MKTKRRNILIALVMSFAMMLSVMAVPDMGMRAEAKSKASPISIYLEHYRFLGPKYQYIDEGKLYAKSQHEWAVYNDGEPIEKYVKIKGFSYNKKSNTITLKNFRYPDFTLLCSSLGPSLKIKLVGKNEIGRLWVSGLARDISKNANASVKICGSGSLVAGKKARTKKNHGTGIGTIECGSIYVTGATGTTLTINKSAKITAYAQKNNENPFFQNTSIAVSVYAKSKKGAAEQAKDWENHVNFKGKTPKLELNHKNSWDSFSVRVIGKYKSW